MERGEERALVDGHEHRRHESIQLRLKAEAREPVVENRRGGERGQIAQRRPWTDERREGME